MSKTKNKLVAVSLCTMIGITCAVAGAGMLVNRASASEADKISTMDMVDGAAVRIADEIGIRYTMRIQTSQYNTLMTEVGEDNTYSSVSFGFLIAPEDYITTYGELTEANVFGEKAIYGWKNETDKYQIVNMNSGNLKETGSTLKDYTDEKGYSYKETNGSLVNIRPENLTREFRGVGYVMFSYEDGTSSYVMYDDGEENVRSMTYIAQLAIEDPEADPETAKMLTDSYITPVADQDTEYVIKRYFDDARGNQVYQPELDTTGTAKIGSSTADLLDEIFAEMEEDPELVGDYELYDASIVDGVEVVYANGHTVINKYYYSTAYSDYSILINGTAEDTDNGTVYTSTATEYEEMVAHEASKYLQEATGLIFPVLYTGEKGAFKSTNKYIVIGNNEFTDGTKSGQTTNLIPTESEVGTDGFKVTTIGKSVFITGATDYGTAYGVYDYLNKVIGLDYYDVDGAYVDTGIDFAVGNYNYTETPDFEGRVSSAGYFGSDLLLMLHNRTTSVRDVYEADLAWHNSFQYLPIATYAAEHPDWYSSGSGADKTQLCYTAHGDATEYAAMIETVKTKMVAKLEADETLTNLTFSIQDIWFNTFCKCDACLANETTYGAKSGSVVKFMNDLSDALAAVGYGASNSSIRDITLTFLAYNDTEKAPTGIKCNANVVPLICPYYTYRGLPLSDAKNSWSKTNIDNWVAATTSKTLSFWFYSPSYYNVFYPTYTVEAMASDYKYVKSLTNANISIYNQPDTDMEGYASGFKKLYAYVSAKLMWNVDLDVNALVDEYFTNYFGVAATAMREYYDSYVEVIKTAQNSTVNNLPGDDKQDGGNWVGYNDHINWVKNGEDYFKGWFTESVLTSWNGMIEDALTAISSLQESAPDTYAKLQERIFTEKVMVEYWLLKLYGADDVDTFGEKADELQAMIEATNVLYTSYDANIPSEYSRFVFDYDARMVSYKLAKLQRFTADNITMYDGQEIAYARKIYEAVKNDVDETYAAYLTAAEALYNAKWVAISDTTSTESYSTVNNFGWQGQLSIQKDDTYGYYLNATYKGGNYVKTNEEQAVISWTLPENIETMVANCDKVYFYVYNGGQNTAQMLIWLDGETRTKVGTLLPGEWTRMTISATDATKLLGMGIFNARYTEAEPCEYKFSMLYAEIAQAQAVIDMIDALPSTEEMTPFDGQKLVAAQNAYNALPVSVQEQVTNYADLATWQAAYNEKFALIYDWTSLDGIKKHSNFGWYGTFNLGTDETYGNVLVGNYVAQAGKEQTALQYTLTDAQKALVSECLEISFYVYNGGVDRGALTNFGGSNQLGTINLKSGEWTKITVSASDFLTGNCLGIFNALYGTSPCTYKFSMIYGEKANIQEVIDAIDALPAVEDIDAFDGATIEEVKEMYDGLPVAMQAQITNVAKLNEVVATYAEKYEIIFDMTSMSGLSKHPSLGFTATFSFVKDSTYGNVLQADWTWSLGEHAAFKYTLTDEQKAKLANCDTVSFYIFNAGVDRYSLHNFGDGKWHTNAHYLPSGQWTKITVSVADFLAGDSFGITNTIYGTNPCTYKFSMIYGEKANTGDVDKLIAALPEASEVAEFDYYAIQEARAAYNALDESTQAKVEDYQKLVDVEEAYANKYYVIFDMTTMDSLEKHPNFDFQGTLTAGVADATYGYVLQGNYTSEGTGTYEEQAAVQYTLTDAQKAALANYETVSFYVYNGGIERQLLHNFGGSTTTKGGTLVAGEWTKITVSASDFLEGSAFGIANAKYGTSPCTYKFSMFYAEMGSTDEVDALIAALPEASEVAGFDYHAIQEARAAYNALDESTQAKVEDYQKLVDVEEAYATKYYVIFDMTTMDGLEKHSNFDFQGTLAAGVADATYGYVLQGDYTSEGTGTYEEQAAVQYTLTDAQKAALANYETVSFYVYNGGVERQLLHNFGGTTTTKGGTLVAGEWTKITVSVADFLTGSAFGIANAKYGTSPCIYKFSMLYAEMGSTDEVEALIDALPTSAELSVLDYSKLAEARAAYNALSEATQARVSNYATLTELEEKFNENWSVFYDMADASGFSTSGTSFSSGGTLSVEADATYGNVLVSDFDRSEDHMLVSYVLPDNASDILADSTYVSFYVWHNSYRSRGLMTDFGGNGYDTGYATLPINTWTKVTVSKADFLSGTYFGIYYAGTKANNTVTGNEIYKFSMFFGENANVENVTALIAALPSADQVDTSNVGALKRATDMFNALSETEQAQVSNAATLTAVQTAFNNKFVDLYDLEALKTIGTGTTPFGIDATATVKTGRVKVVMGGDSEYGRLIEGVYNFNSTLSISNIAVSYAQPATDLLDGCESVVFYVYNNAPVDKTLMADFGGTAATNYATLKAGEWTKIAVSVEDFKKGTYYGVYNVTDGTAPLANYLFTEIYGVKA